jgi:hypothetical protein
MRSSKPEKNKAAFFSTKKIHNQGKEGYAMLYKRMIRRMRDL